MLLRVGSLNLLGIASLGFERHAPDERAAIEQPARPARTPTVWLSKTMKPSDETTIAGIARHKAVRYHHEAIAPVRRATHA